MKAGEVVFQKLLDGKIQYVVPLYQRRYSWEEKQWQQLWEDLLEVYGLEEPRNHFIGSIVTQQVPMSPESVSRYTLIDGQQRMTTLLIVLGVIRRRAIESEEYADLAQEIQETCLINKFVSDDGKNKLMPTQADRLDFVKVIGGGIPSGASQIARARKYFDDMLNSGDDASNDIDLRKLHSRIVNNLDMVSIHLESSDSPNRIFESLNNTGMPLSVADLIRNFLLMNILDLEQQEQAYQNLWYPMEQLLGNSAADFFWQYLMMDGSRPRKDETYEKVQDILSPASPDSSVGALSDFSKFSNYYSQVAEIAEVSLDEGLTQRIRRLNRWEVTVAYPFLMRALDFLACEKIEEPGLELVMDLIESYIIRRTVCGVPTNQLRRIFASMAAQIQPGTDFPVVVANHLNNNRWPGDDEFRQKFIEFPFYSPARVDRTNLVLWTLEQAYGHKESPQITQAITIEHIMPQSLNSDWHEELGDDALEVHSRWLHTIGNLTLTGYNSSLGNKPFKEKKVDFQGSNFALTSSVVGYDKWNESSITTRGAELANMAVQIWKRQ